jgi:bacterioferritin-associated ferredoxin
MYVCVCKAVTDTQIRSALAEGLCTARQLAHGLGVGKECGKCVKHIKGLLDVTPPAIAAKALAGSVVHP